MVFLKYALLKNANITLKLEKAGKYERVTSCQVREKGDDRHTNIHTPKNKCDTTCICNEVILAV